jgi:hypothetical protein
MLDLFDKITALLGASNGDLDQIEHTLTDGYAFALSLEAEQWRLEKRIAEVVQEIQHGATAGRVAELGTLANRRDLNARELVKLRRQLAELRLHLGAL